MCVRGTLLGMGNRLAALAVAGLVCCGSLETTSHLRAPGRARVPGASSVRLPRTFTPIAYRAHLAVDPEKSNFDGSMTIDGELTEATSRFWLHGRDLAIHLASAVPVTGSSVVPLEVTPRGEDVLELRAGSSLAPGGWSISIQYAGVLDELNSTGAFKVAVDGAAYVYTQFEPVYARRVFPCMDEPDSKVSWQLTLDVPRNLNAVSNTSLAQTVPLSDGRMRYEFRRSLPLPSYLVAFGVGPFDIVEAADTRSDVKVRIVALHGRSADAAYAAKTTSSLIEALETWFAIPYPYDKLDILTLPQGVGFGAMENAGLITVNEGIALFDQRRPAPREQHAWMRVAAHEIAHQWFGGYVTMAWWDDIWLNEGFANWMEIRTTALIDPSWRDELSAVDIRSQALEADSLTSARRIRQPIESPDDVLNVFDGITYDKGSAVLSMFESYLGSDVFQRGVRQYLKSRALANASSSDFVRAMSEVAGTNLGPAFTSFLEQSGAPELDAELECGDGQPRLKLTQRAHQRRGSPEGAPKEGWIFPVCVAYDSDGQRAEACTLLDGSGLLTLNAQRCPSWVMPNLNGRGYYRSSLTEPRVRALRDVAWPALTWSERRALFYDISNSGRSVGRGDGVLALPSISLALALSLVPKLLSGGNRFTVGDAVALPSAVDRMVPEELRPRYEYWMRSTFSPAARELGTLPREGDDLNAESQRLSLLQAAGWLGRDSELVSQAMRHARTWRELPRSTRGILLTLAVDRDPALFPELTNALRTETDAEVRWEMLSALAAVRDPLQLPAALALVLDPRLDFRETLAVLLGTTTEATRRVAERFFRKHRAAIMQRMPQDDVLGGIAAMTGLFTTACDAVRREEIVSYLTAHFAVLRGGKHAVDEAVEAMDQCIAARTELTRQIWAWLGPVRISSN
jgi:cytosol alanyl aminopeptidase